MAIPESQLETWAKQGSVTQSSMTYATIKRALEDSSNNFANRKFKIFLQGSYSNDTNVYSESDVDIVICFSDIYYYGDELLPADQKIAFKNTLSGSTSLSYDDFKNEVYHTLVTRFGSGAVSLGSKAITLEANGSRRKSDVLVAVEFRRYNKFIDILNHDYSEGICFFDSSGMRIENYPKYHSISCTKKHSDTNQYFKPIVRILKNMRNKLVESGAISDDLAPSYFIEGLFYNVPDSCFAGEYKDSFVATINWLSAADKSEFVCPNEHHYLLREDPVCWQNDKCEAFLKAAVKFWNDW